MAAVRAVLFDFGHTIVDFHFAEENLLACYEEIRQLIVARASQEVPEATALVNEVSRRVAQTITASYEERELEELDMVELFDSALRVVGLHLPLDLVRDIVRMEHRALVTGLNALPQNIDVLRQLKNQGLKLGLVSNATLLPEMMHEDIARLGIAGYMDAAVFSSEAGVRKPHPGIFWRVLRALEVQPEDAVFVGDRVHDDIGGAKQIGMRGVLTHEFRQEDPGRGSVKPDHLIMRLPEIIPYVSSPSDDADAGPSRGTASV